MDIDLGLPRESFANHLGASILRCKKKFMKGISDGDYGCAVQNVQDLERVQG